MHGARRGGNGEIVPRMRCHGADERITTGANMGSQDPPRGDDAAPPPVRVLLVEDAPTIAGFVSYVLEESGCEVAHVPSVAEAREVLAERWFDLVIADLRLPDGRGEEVVEAARARDAGVAIIVASGEAAVVDGADAMLLKPFSTEELKDALRRALEHRRAAG